MNILLVEDNNADAELLMDLFTEKNANLQFNWMVDGDSALKYLENMEEKPDLVLLDLSLPRVSGYEVLQAIKGTESAKDIPVIILTTSANPKDVVECKKLGAAAFLSKPSTLADYSNLADCLIAAELPRHIYGNI